MSECSEQEFEHFAARGKALVESRLAQRKPEGDRVSAPETPRTWTLEMSPSGCDGEDFHVQALGPDVGWDEKPEVIEKTPVDVERERLLDLLEDALLWLERIPPPEEEVRALGRGLWDETLENVQAALREYGRLGKEKS